MGEPSSDPPEDTLRPQSKKIADSTSCFKTDAPVTSTLPSQEPFSSTVSENNEATGSVISGDSIDLRTNSTSSEKVLAESLTLNPSSQTLDQEVDMDISSNAKLETVQDFPHQLQREQDMEDVSGAQPQLMPVPDMNLQPCPAKLATSSEHSPVNSDSEKSMEGGLALERDQDNIPSLAQALKELHNLLMSNSPQVLNIPTPRLDADGVARDPAARNPVIMDPTRDSTSITATTDDMEDGVAKTDLTSQTVGDTSDLATSSNPTHPENQTKRLVDTVDEQKMQCPDENQELTKEDFGLPSSIKEHQDVRECLEGQDIAEVNTSGIDTFNSADLSQQRPLSVASGSSTDFTLEPVASPHPQTQAPEVDPSLGDSIQPGPQSSMGQFPLEHIQRIQASGFSANEAAEALEQAQGSVELALLMLLARKITVPT